MELILTHVLWCTHDLSDLLTAAYQPRQAKIHNLYVPERRFTGEEDILRLTDQNTFSVKLANEHMQL